MPSIMTTPALQLVDAATPGAQRVAVLEKPGVIAMRHAAVPVPNDDQVLVKVTYVGICGSDLETFRGHRAAEFVSIPSRLGHEVAGYVVAVGKHVAGIQVGAQVTCRYVW